MATLDLASMTVIELRKLAKANGVTLGAGVNKESIIAKISQVLGDQPQQDEPASASEPDAPVEPQQDEPKVETAPVQTQPETQPQQTQYRAAWHNPTPRYNSKPAYQAPAYPQRQNNGWQGNRSNSMEPMRPTQTRPVNNGFTPRFGPSARDDHQTERRPYGDASRTMNDAPQRSAYDSPRNFDAGYETTTYQQPRQSAYDQRSNGYDQRSNSYDQRPNGYEQRSAGYDQRPTPYDQRGGYDQRPRYEQRPSYTAPRRDNFYAPAAPTEPLSPAAAAELLSPSECLDGSGVLELHPDGYGFLRSDNFLPSTKDIYVSIAQIRRFGLRTGDYVVGKTRPQRDGDKYAAMLYINEVNGETVDNLIQRPMYDELTPVYPSRRIDLESHDGNDVDTMRLADLITPLGFGQRGLILCPPETGKPELLRDFANAITRNYPDVNVMVLLIDENPEDVTCFRDQVHCPVLASTFDQPPENHLRLADLVLERAQRLVEQGKDVVIIADSLTRLAKTYTTTAAQQGRGLPGMVNPTSLFRAKKLFGAARCMKEGGSLTVIGTMNIETGNKVDDTIVEEFKGTANMELWLDASMAQAGVTPAINLQLSGTKRAELLLSPSQLEGLKLIRSMMSSTRSITAVPQLLSMMDKAGDNDELMERIKDWAALMNTKS